MIMVSSAKALMARYQGVNNRKDRATLSTRCRFCDAYHWSDECPKYTTMESRKQRIQDCCYKLQTTPWHREEEPLNHHETPGKQIKHSNQLSLPHQDDCNTKMDIK